MMINALSVNPKDFQDIQQFRITDEELFVKAAGGCHLDTYLKIVENSPFNPLNARGRGEKKKQHLNLLCTMESMTL